ncbi:TerB family tellurite resistance protein [Microvirga sp. 2TAF3]|uniref:TerB family tellurite resistance protein n=1 Tax=Microvirga sp. 2TAF3 TaxID=3233014 RepID=UPI003F9B0866
MCLISRFRDLFDQTIGPDERPRLLALAYRVAAIDGVVHEFEDDLIWRMGRLLGLSAETLAAIKGEALKNLMADQAHV